MKIITSTLRNVLPLLLLLAIFSCSSPVADQPESQGSKDNSFTLEAGDLLAASVKGKPVGFGAGTTGGKGGVTRSFSSFSAMKAYFKTREKNQKEKVIVVIKGTMSGSGMLSVKRTANVTFIGQGKAVAKGWGINIRQSKNVIVQNITFDGYNDDGVTVDASSKVWVDHNTFTRGKDGACDVKKGSTGVTVSWNKFINTEKTCLFGHSVKQTGDKSMRATYHHNYFNGARSRMPRARYGKAHVYNNYFENVGLYAIASTCNAEVLSENNYFKNCPVHSIIYSKKGSAAAKILSNNPPGKVKSKGDKFDNAKAPMLNTSGFGFRPPYGYSLSSASKVPSLVKSKAGANR